MRILFCVLLALSLMSCATRQPEAPMWGRVAKEIGRW